jgi:hypothetical protein
LQYRVVILVLALCTPAAAFSAPPTVDSFYPAGVARGGSVTVTATGAIDPWPPNVWVDRADVQVVPAEAKGQFVVTASADAAPGICRVRVHNDAGAAVLRPLVVGLLPELNEIEPNNAPAAAQAIDAASATVNGRFDSGGDVDVFAVTLRQGQVLVAAIDANRSLGSPCDAVLQVVSPAGFVLAHNDDDRGLDPRIEFTAPADGRYLVRTFAFPATPDSTINFSGSANHVYRLTLATGPFADHAWPLAVPRGQPTNVRLMGWNIPEELANVALTPPDDGELMTLSPPGLANAVGVSLEPQPVTVEAEPNGLEQPQPIELPVPISGRIDPPRDVDVYQFSAAAGQAWVFRCDARGLGSPLDPVISIIDAAGAMVARVDDIGAAADAELAFTAPAAGAFRVLVSDLHHRGGMRYVYRLRAAAPRPDFALTVAAEVFTVVVGTPLEIPVTIERRGGFAEEIEIAVDGLPEGVTAAAVKSLPLGDTAAAGPRNAPIRIIGRALGESSRSHAAETPTAGADARTSDLWLTASSP